MRTVINIDLKTGEGLEWLAGVMGGPHPTAADRYFSICQYLPGIAEEQMSDLLVAACGMDPSNVDTWVMDDIIYDHYDHSFELLNVKGDWAPTPEQLQACWALGFGRCWVCYDDGTERYFDAMGISGARHPSHRHRATSPGSEPPKP